MKTTIKILLLTTIMTINLGCENATPPTSGGPGIETVAGFVSNENGDPLEGIRIEIYYDKALQEHYPDGNYWYDMSDEDKKKYADKEPITYTDKEGRYSQSRSPRVGQDTFDIYVVAIDTAGVYERQVKKGVIRYWGSPIWENGFHDISGKAEVDFILTPSKKYSSTIN
jgi:hypothetical protein